MENPVTWQVFIADANPLIRFGLKAVVNLHPHMTVCGEAGNAIETLELCQKHSPDLIILDILFSRCEGIQLLGDLAQRHPHSRLVVVSGAKDALSIQRAVRSGAHAYVTKQEEPTEILAALGKVYAGESFFSKCASEALLDSISIYDSGTFSAELKTLSDRELQIFRLVGKKYGTTKIARELRVSVKTVETHQRRIKIKLGLSTGKELHRAAERWNATLHDGS